MDAVLGLTILYHATMPAANAARARMSLVIDARKMLEIEMRVDLSGADIAMSQ